MLTLIGILLLLYGGWRALYANLALRRDSLNLVKRSHQPKLAILIPARDESRVIEGLLKSISAQTYPISMQDVYVIVETMDDPTVKICQNYQAQVILRKHVDLQRKGYALDEALRQILPKHHYDLYFIFDADNRLAPNYLNEMLKTYALGYQMATGYRHAKNNNYNVIAAVSALTFTMINTLGNKNRIRHGANIIFSGTGCFIDGELIEKWHGWPFHSLTEDYEMSLYAILNNISTFYNEKAVFYDEQPTKYRQTVDQRVRWIKGYFSARHHYIPLMRKRAVMSNQGSLIKERIGVRPIILVLIGLICIMFDDIRRLFLSQNLALMLGIFGGLLVLVYLVLMIITVTMIKREQMSFTPRIKRQAILYNPIYLLTYVPCALRALFTRNVTWKKIEHGKRR